MIDLNCDLGEIDDDVKSGAQERILPFIHRASVACGGHAGDDETMHATVAQCLRHGVLVGAHPSYPDRAGFGRTSLALSPDELILTVRAQVDRLVDVLLHHAAHLAHIKPHGALYHDVGTDPARARAFLDAVRGYACPVILMARAPTTSIFTDAGIIVLGEAFADRAYEPDGSLRPRSKPGALVDDPARAAEQAARLVEEGWASTLCVHGDTPGAVEIARAVHTRVFS